MVRQIENLIGKDDGQNTLMIGVVVLVIWVAVSVFAISSSVTTIWSNVNSEVAQAPGAGS